RLAKIQDPLALMANSNNPYASLAPHQDLSAFNQNYMQQPMPNPEDITNSTTAMNMALALMAKAFKLNYSTPTNNNQRISSNLWNRQIAQPGNLNGYNAVQNVRNQGIKTFCLRLHCQAKEKGCCLSSDIVIDCSEERGWNPTSSRRTDSAPIYDSDGSADVHEYENCYNNEIFNMFTQEEQYTELLEPVPEPQQVPQNDNNVISEYTELLEPVPEPQQVPQNDNNVISEVTDVEQGRETIEQHSVNFEETRALYDSLYQNLAIEVEKVNSVNRNLKETNADLTTELARNNVFLKR
nr:hypothetical protein [Tanacetum cinerariifolium]